MKFNYKDWITLHERAFGEARSWYKNNDWKNLTKDTVDKLNEHWKDTEKEDWVTIQVPMCGFYESECDLDVESWTSYAFESDYDTIINEYEYVGNASKKFRDFVHNFGHREVDGLTFGTMKYSIETPFDVETTMSKFVRMFEHVVSLQETEHIEKPYILFEEVWSPAYYNYDYDCLYVRMPKKYYDELLYKKEVFEDKKAVKAWFGDKITRTYDSCYEDRYSRTITALVSYYWVHQFLIDEYDDEIPFERTPIDNAFAACIRDDESYLTEPADYDEDAFRVRYDFGSTLMKESIAPRDYTSITEGINSINTPLYVIYNKKVVRVTQQKELDINKLNIIKFVNYASDYITIAVTNITERPLFIFDTDNGKCYPKCSTVTGCEVYREEDDNLHFYIIA